MSNKATIDLRDFNRGCKTIGVEPFPADEIKMDFDGDKDFLDLKIQKLKDSLKSWLDVQT